MTTDHKRRTFISYSRVNKEFAIKLAQELKSDMIPIWLDQFDIPTGARWDNELENALRDCEIFLIVLTPASITSENVKDEIGYAIDHGKSILPVLLETCEIPLRLRRFQYVDFTQKNYSDGIESAKELLRAFINQPSLPTQTAAEPVEAEKTSLSEFKRRNLPSKTLIGSVIAVVAVIVLAIVAVPLLRGKPSSQAANNPPTEVSSSKLTPTSPEPTIQPVTETPTTNPPTPTVKPLTDAEINTLPLASEGTKILSSAEAAQLNAQSIVKSTDDLAKEKYTDGQLSLMGRFKKFYLELPKSEPILQKDFWCAATENDLKDNLKQIELNFELDGQKIPESSLSRYDYTNTEWDWPCQGVYVIVDGWTSGKHILKYKLNIKNSINDGESDYAPGIYESEEFIVVFP